MTEKHAFVGGYESATRIPRRPESLSKTVYEEEKCGTSSKAAADPTAGAATKRIDGNARHKVKGKFRTHRKTLKIYPPPRTISTKCCELVIGRKLGIGGYSQCYLAQSPTGEEFATKFIPRDNGRSRRDGLEQIKREMRVHHRLDHENIVKLWQLIECEKHIALVLEYCPNNTLQELISRRGAMLEPAACEAMGYIMCAVDYMHAQLIHHGDLKLSNILLNAKMQPVIADFGFAKELPFASYMRTHLCGTPSYMAPEILGSPCEFGLPSDVWALGIIAYYLLYGRPMFESRDVPDVYARIRKHDVHFPPLDPPVSPGLLLLIRTMLRASPQLRPSVRQLVDVYEVNECGLFCGDVRPLLSMIPLLTSSDSAFSEDSSAGAKTDPGSGTGSGSAIGAGSAIGNGSGTGTGADSESDYQIAVAEKTQVLNVPVSTCVQPPLNETRSGLHRAWCEFWSKRISTRRRKRALPAT